MSRKDEKPDMVWREFSGLKAHPKNSNTHPSEQVDSIAADQLDRICYGIEISCAYTDVIVKRYINHVGSDEHVYVERNGAQMSWEQAQKKLPKVI